MKAKNIKSINSTLQKNLFIILILIVSSIQAQTTIYGFVKDINGNPLDYASVSVDSLAIGTTTDANGNYTLKDLPFGIHKISTSILGYETKFEFIHIDSNTSKINLNFNLNTLAKGLNEVIISETRKNEVEKAREQAYTVSSIDVKPLQNLNLDINKILNKSTGIRIRQQGGLGSDFNFSLNGFSGKQIRFFIDGISTEYLGSAMQFNNIPVNIIDRIEVYKGVVPVNLGADALGGAVNVITNDNGKNFLDASYSFSSFNTHQIAIASRATIKKHYVINTSGFFNYSDNNYPIDVQLVDPITGKISNPQPMKLFNEKYISGSALIEGGVVNTKWADRFLIGIIGSGNKKGIQRGRAMVLNPAGLVYRSDVGVTPTLKYQKKNLFTKNLNLNLSAIYSYTKSTAVDTSSRIYSWDGTYTTKDVSAYSGEISWYKTNFRFNDHAALVTTTLDYLLGKHHTFTFNNTYSYFYRKGTDPIGSQYQSNLAFSDPNTISKNITGLSYKFSWWDNRWNTTVFAKLYHMNARVYSESFSNGIEYKQNKMLKHGEGIATSIFATHDLQLKLSYEYTSRLPESYELFGDGLLLLSNVNLNPEQSHNFNFGILYGKRFEKGHSVNTEFGFVFRLPENMIRLVSMGVMAMYQNLSKARVFGAEASIRYSYKHWVNVEVNATYQDMRNNEKKYDTDPLYLDRVPNIPYVFGNVSIGTNSPELSKHKFQVGCNWSTMYVEKFYLNWPSQGSQNTKFIIPRQIAHDLSFSFSVLSGKYNISIACLNLLNSKLYDDYKIQKPGRTFDIKFRVYLDKFSK